MLLGILDRILREVCTTLAGYFKPFGVLVSALSHIKNEYAVVLLRKHQLNKTGFVFSGQQTVCLTTQVQKLFLFHSSTNRDIYGIICDQQSGDKNRVPMLHLEKPAGILAAGASGCPVMIKRDETYHLVGLHFSGDNDDEDGESEALPWNRGIRDYIHKGVEIIAQMNSYLANKKISSAMPEAAEKASKTMSELMATAKKYKLTIYFPNGDV